MKLNKNLIFGLVMTALVALVTTGSGWLDQPWWAYVPLFLVCYPWENESGDVYSLFGGFCEEEGCAIWSLVSVYQKSRGNAYSLLGNIYQDAEGRAAQVIGINLFQRGKRLAAQFIGVSVIQVSREKVGQMLGLAFYQEGKEFTNEIGSIGLLSRTVADKKPAAPPEYGGEFTA